MRYHRPSKFTIAATLVLAVTGSLVFALSNPVEVRVDGQPVISDVPPVTTAKGVFVPLRSVDDALGAETKYDRKSGEVVVTRGDESLHLKIGSTHVSVNGRSITLRNAPFRVRGRVMVTLRTVQEAFGVRAKFDKMTARVELSTPGVSADATAFQ
jgi:hypothetical protein